MTGHSSPAANFPATRPPPTDSLHRDASIGIGYQGNASTFTERQRKRWLPYVRSTAAGHGTHLRQTWPEAGHASGSSPTLLRTRGIESSERCRTQWRCTSFTSATSMAAAAVLFGLGDEYDVDEQVGDCLGGVARRSALFVAMWGQYRRTASTRRKPSRAGRPRPDSNQIEV